MLTVGQKISLSPVHTGCSYDDRFTHSNEISDTARIKVRDRLTKFVCIKLGLCRVTRVLDSKLECSYILLLQYLHIIFNINK